VAEGKLPDLPGSTDEDLSKNEYHPFFKKTPRDFWLSAEINHSRLNKIKKCDHKFRYVKGGVECEKCFMGLTGDLMIRKGKLFYKDQPIFQDQTEG